MASSFKAIQFEERGEGGRMTPTWSTSADATIHRIPGGTRIVIQSSGQKEDTLAMPIRCTAAQLSSLRTAVDSKGSLVFSGGTRQAYLRAVENPVEVKQGKNVYFATLQFVGL